MKILMFAGSLRKDSLNKKLLRVTEKIVKDVSDHTTNIVDLQPLQLPVYDGDIESKGMPANVEKLGELVKNADFIIIATPEYNRTLSSPLKNTIDWLSRLKPMPLEKKPVLLIGTSPGPFGAVRGLLASRAPLDGLGSFVYPENFALAKGDQAFNGSAPHEELIDPGAKKRLTELVKKYLEFSEKLTGAK